MDFLDKAFVPARRTVPFRKSRGGLRDISELTDRTAQTVPGYFLSSTFDPKVTVTYQSITFNPSCVNFFEDCRYFSVRIDDLSLRMIVEPTTEGDKNGLKVAYFRNGKNVPRPCTAKPLCAFLFDLMKWNPEAKYRMKPDFRDYRERNFLVFNLDECVELIAVHNQ